jgi:hypothetical protein
VIWNRVMSLPCRRYSYTVVERCAEGALRPRLVDVLWIDSPSNPQTMRLRHGASFVQVGGLRSRLLTHVQETRLYIDYFLE